MPKKMASTGGFSVGVAWDDGAHDNVTKVQVSHDSSGVNFIKFYYLDGTDTITGDEYSHGKISDSSPQTEEFELDRDEYVTEMEAYVVYVGNVVGEVMKLKFKTNKRTSKAYGLDAYVYSRRIMVFGERNKKIVGFHGNSGDRLLHEIGVYVSPITKTKSLKQLAFHYLRQIKNKII